MAELYTSAAASALEDGCRALGLSNEAAPELLKYMICSAKQGQLGLEQHMFPSSKLEQLWQWMSGNQQVSEVVSELVCGPVEAPSRSHDGLSETDVLMERLYALNILALGRYAPSIELWQEPNGAPIVATGGCPVAYSSPALSGEQQQQLAADLQGYIHAESSGHQGSPEAPEPYGMPWKIAVNMPPTNYKPATTYAVRAVQGLTVHEFKRELLRQSMSAQTPQELRLRWREGAVR